MKKKIAMKMGALGFAAVWVALLMGCSTTAYEKADKTGAGFVDFRDEVVQNKKAINESIKSLDRLKATADTDPREAYQSFSKSVSRVASTRNTAGKRAKKVKKDGDAYFVRWKKELSEIQNPELRALAEARWTEARESFDQMGPLLSSIKSEFDPFLADLRDLDSFLGSDLTQSSITASADMMKEVRSSGFELRDSLDDLVAEFSKISDLLSPQSK